MVKFTKNEVQFRCRSAQQLNCLYSHCDPIVPPPSHKNLPSSLEKGYLHCPRLVQHSLLPKKIIDSSSLTSSCTKIMFIKSEYPFTT